MPTPCTLVSPGSVPEKFPFFEAFIPFRSHVRVRYDARSKTDLPPLITFIDGNRSNRNIERRLAAGIDPSHGAGICAAGVRSEERRVGKECVRACVSRWAP